MWGFFNTTSDNSLFVYKNQNDVLFLLVYVDNMLITRNHNEILNNFVQKLDKTFSLKDLGSIHYFLGLDVHRDSIGMYLSQSKYVLDLLNKFDMLDSAPFRTLMIAGKILSAHKGESLKNPSLYINAIGALQYLSDTKPYISYSMNKLSQFLIAPTSTHW